MSVQPKFSMLATTRHVGWGGVSKLRMILERLPHASVTLHGDAHAVAITKKYLGPQHPIQDNPASKFDVALIINDPPAVNTIADLGAPVVFVDSLCYVRKATEFPPLDRIACYCGQKYPLDVFPVAAPLQNRDNVKWVDPIIPAPQKRRGGGGVVINLGGLYVHNLAGLSSDLVNRGIDAYLDLVLFPLVGLLLSSNRKILAICGNINEEGCRKLRALLPDGVAVGPQSGPAFERILMDADFLISAPGTTTLLQAASLDLPTILLPAENRSQIPNARAYTKRGADLGEWPEHVISGADFERMHSRSVGEVYQFFFQSFVNAAASKEAQDEVLAVLRRVLSNAPADGILDPRLRELGTAGAEQVAQLITQVALRSK